MSYSGSVVRGEGSVEHGEAAERRGTLMCWNTRLRDATRRRAQKKGPKCMKCKKDSLGAPGDIYK